MADLNIFLPENFDIDRHIDAFPPFENGFPDTVKFHSYKVGIFLDLLTSIPARNKDLISSDGFVNINMKTIRNSIKDILLYISYLLDTGIIEIDRQFFPGERSRRYKWAGKFENSRFVSRPLKTKYSQVVSELGYTSKSLPEYLSHWYDQKKLTIDPIAEVYTWDVKEAKMQDESRISWDINGSNGELKDPRIQYRAAIRNISKIMSCNYGAHMDNHIHRLHSVLTSIQKDYRNYITYDGKPLVCIDIKNSQPYLACLLFNPEFWKKDSVLPLTIFDLPSNITSKATDGHGMIPTVVEFLSTPRNFGRYIDLVSSGLLYEEIMNLVAQIPNSHSISRKQAKTMMFYMLFSSNRGSNYDPVVRELREMFGDTLFPDVAQLFWIVKQVFDIGEKKQHNRLSLILQAIESQIILHNCCKRIWEDRKQSIPVFTIHDSIVTTEENVGFVFEVMMQELTRHIGVSPKLDIEKWSN